MNSSGITWRDRFRILISMLYCIIGVALIARFLEGRLPLLVVTLGVAFLGLGGYRLFLAGKEIRKRVRGSQ